MTAALADHLRASDITVVSGAHYLVAQCDHATLAAAMRVTGKMADALVVDAPYSAAVHDGHDACAPDAVRKIDYACWGAADVAAFVGAWHPLVRGWLVSVSDDELGMEWKRSLRAAYRYVFPLIPCTERGATVRMAGDGPSSCTTFLTVSRPRERSFLSWGCTESHYVVARERKLVVGGKALALMLRIVRDYSREGDVVCDPCMGAGTTLVAAVQLGRFGLGSEPDAGRFAMACKRLETARPQLRMRLDDVETVTGKQSALALTEDT